MDVGIGLPKALLDVEGPELVAWAQRAEQRGFSVLGTIGRIAYDSHEELIALAAAAGATERAGEKPDGALLPVGPKPPHLPIVLGAYSDPAFRRVGRLADAFVVAPVPPEAVAGAYEVVKAGAAEAQREAPALYAACYVAVGDDVADEADRNVRSYYGDLAPMVQGGILRSSDDLRESLDSLRQVGVVEVCLWPLARGIDQVDRIADAALQVQV
jgi:alkanesulfonate monooxygenase SsuD/methylene tetrahydromethanopterin reductase-like flavin-dependent oxidoreductase (luciferase family)